MYRVGGCQLQIFQIVCGFFPHESMILPTRTSPQNFWTWRFWVFSRDPLWVRSPSIGLHSLRQAIPEWFAHAAPQPYLTERPTISTEAILALGVLAVGKFPGKDGIKSCQSCWERMKGSFLEVKQQKPLKMYRAPKRKEKCIERLPTIIFQGCVRLQSVVIQWKWRMTCLETCTSSRKSCFTLMIVGRAAHLLTDMESWILIFFEEQTSGEWNPDFFSMFQ